MKPLPTLALIATLALHSPAVASVFLRLGIDAGGEDIGLVAPDGSRVLRVSSATGYTLEFGKRIQALQRRGIDVVTEIVVGHKRGATDNAIGSLQLDRYLLGFNRFYGAGAWRLGVGLSLHNNFQMRASGDGFGGAEQAVWTVSESVGYSAMLDYSLTKNARLGLRATSQRYHLADRQGTSAMADANSVGLFFNLSLE